LTAPARSALGLGITGLRPESTEDPRLLVGLGEGNALSASATPADVVALISAREATRTASVGYQPLVRGPLAH
jgi:hypothetical protein